MNQKSRCEFEINEIGFPCSPAQPLFFCLSIGLSLATSLVDIALEKWYVSNHVDLDDSRRFAFSSLPFYYYET